MRNNPEVFRLLKKRATIEKLVNLSQIAIKKKRPPGKSFDGQQQLIQQIPFECVNLADATVPEMSHISSGDGEI